jgi:uncharacterized membrane protein
MLGVLVLAAAFHWVTIVAYPYVLTSTYYRVLTRLAGTNVFLHLDQPTANNRAVGMLNPDLVYSAAAFDLSEGPVRVTVPISGLYMSLSFYAANTDNFFVMNDLQVKDGRFDIVLVGSVAADPNIQGVHIVRSPTTTGIIALRCFVGKGDQLNKIEATRRQIRCVVLE